MPGPSGASPSSPLVPVHEQVSTTLRARIRSGVLAVGDQLPSEAALMAEFGVARGTIRRALRTLNEQGVVQTLRGKGTFVRSRDAEASIGQALVGLGEALSYSDRKLTTDVLHREILRDANEARFPVALDEGEQILFLDRVRRLDGTPVARLKNWVRIDLAPTIIDVDFSTVALFDALDETTGGRVSSGRRTFRAVLPPPEVARSLQVSNAHPLLCLTQTTFLDRGEPIEHSTVWMDSEHLTVSINLTRHTTDSSGRVSTR